MGIAKLSSLHMRLCINHLDTQINLSLRTCKSRKTRPGILSYFPYCILIEYSFTSELLSADPFKGWPKCLQDSKNRILTKHFILKTEII